jgi:hypothetical protein
MRTLGRGPEGTLLSSGRSRGGLRCAPALGVGRGPRAHPEPQPAAPGVRDQAGAGVGAPRAWVPRVPRSALPPPDQRAAQRPPPASAPFRRTTPSNRR